MYNKPIQLCASDIVVTVLRRNGQVTTRFWLYSVTNPPASKAQLLLKQCFYHAFTSCLLYALHFIIIIHFLTLGLPEC